MIRKVAVIMGSDSDWPVVKGACAQLKALDIPFEAHILSAHRTPAEAADFAKRQRQTASASSSARRAWQHIWLVLSLPTPPCRSSASR